MAKSRHKKSEETSANDGRQYNKRLAPKPISTKDKMLPASRTTKSKKDRLYSYGISAMKEKFGSEKEFFQFLLEQATDGKSFNHLKMFMEYTYGKASDSIDDTAKKSNKTAPIINFNVKDVSPQIDNTIDITPDEDTDNA